MKRPTTIILSAALMLTLSSCTAKQDDTVSVMASKLNAYEATISTLSDRLSAMQQSQELEKKENDKKLGELSAQLEELKKQDTPTQTPQEPTPDDNAAQGFKYIITEGVASITGYEGDSTKIVIPATIGGYRVTSIADGAFENSKLTDVIISDGIERIGWFAFGNCAELKSITIPSSVTSIGYGALGTAESSLFIYCHADSFALSYAKSYGLSYAVI